MNIVSLKWSMRKDARSRKPPVSEKPKMTMVPLWGSNAKRLCWRLFGTTDRNVAWRHYHPLTLQQKIVAEANKAVTEKWSGASIQSWYGMKGAWCAMAWSRIKNRAGSKSSKYAFVPYVVSDAAHGKNGLRIVSSPQPGDGVCYDWQGDKYADHIGTLLRKFGGLIYVAEGNAGSDRVTKKVRTTANVLCFVRVTK